MTKKDKKPVVEKVSEKKWADDVDSLLHDIFRYAKSFTSSETLTDALARIGNADSIAVIVYILRAAQSLMAPLKVTSKSKVTYTD